jgi:hypothetical protein
VTPLQLERVVVAVVVEVEAEAEIEVCFYIHKTYLNNFGMFIIINT